MNVENKLSKQSFISLFIYVDNSKVISNNNRNNKKLAEFDFIKAIYRVKNLSFSTFNF